MVKNPSAKAGDTRGAGVIPGLGDPPEWEMVIHSSVPAWEIPWTEESGGHNPQGHKESDTTERLSPHACNLFLRTYK